MKIPNKAYDICKWIVMLLLPGVATFYKLLCGVWGWPYADEISITLTGLATFLGGILCISTATYNKEVK
nr:MAG TPA: holin [Caudoviricetes sp.]